MSPPPKYVSEKTVPALRRHARDNGIQVPAKARKDELVAAVAKHESRRMLNPAHVKKVLAGVPDAKLRESAIKTGVPVPDTASRDEIVKAVVGGGFVSTCTGLFCGSKNSVNVYDPVKADAKTILEGFTEASTQLLGDSTKHEDTPEHYGFYKYLNVLEQRTMSPNVKENAISVNLENIGKTENRIIHLIEKGCTILKNSNSHTLDSLKEKTRNENLKNEIGICLSKDDFGLEDLEEEYKNLQERMNNQSGSKGGSGKRTRPPRAP